MTQARGAVRAELPEVADDLVVVDGLARHFALDKRANQVVRAVDDVSFAIRRGETFGLVGESGSGKSTLARLLLRLDRPTAGRVLFDGIDVASLSARELRKLRWRMQIVFQDPFASLNRRRTVEQTIELPLRVHQPQLKSAERAARVRELLDLVGLRSSHATAYPRELSGGQCQRVSIARALSIRPEFVVLDEAVSAVDVSIQAQILNLLRELQGRLGLTYLFVSHDLSVVRYMSNTIGVMYHGKIVELGSREQLFSSPRHPYTHGLLASIPVPDPEVERARERERAQGIVRDEVAAGAEVSGCRFHPRCPLGTRERCRAVEPPLELVEPEHYAACHFPQSAESLARAAAAEATPAG
ncbi:MAG TPA: oligopeptide/dipeptide ABC transporter ATP-binding protein [Gaiellaceae bacterium]|nr:oligopeptide/dipeptide ABC transporter ATP-binding protein [Gaiellaceae bacterium]